MMISNTKFGAVDSFQELPWQLLNFTAAWMGGEPENHLNRVSEWALGTVLFVGLVWEKWVKGGVSYEKSPKNAIAHPSITSLTSPSNPAFRRRDKLFLFRCW